MTLKITNAKIVLRDGVLDGGVLVIDGDTISYVGTLDTVKADSVYDAGGAYLLPGFIDIHSHGGGGFDFMDATAEEMLKISDFHLSHGTTTLVATTLTDTWAAIEAALDTFASLGERRKTLHGVHLEGPWFSPKQCGAQSTETMQKPSAQRLISLKAKYPFIERVSLAPEEDIDFAVGKAGKESGVIIALGHTDADFDTARASAKNGYTVATHLYSGMKGVERVNAYRVAGCVEGVLYDDSLIAEVIADGKHLPEGLLKLIYKCKGADNICLVTDSTRGAGMKDGEEMMLGKLIGGTPAIIEDGVAKLPDRKSFAGSVATADRLFYTMLSLSGAPIHEVSKMMSATPARAMGYTDRGEIKAGLLADLVVLDNEYKIKNIFLKGEMVK